MEAGGHGGHPSRLILFSKLLNPESFSLGVCKGHLAVHLPIIDLWKFGV